MEQGDERVEELKRHRLNDGTPSEFVFELPSVCQSKEINKTFLYFVFCLNQLCVEV